MLAITVFILSYAAFASGEITVLIDGERLACSQAPFIKDGTAFVPMRDIFQKIGADVQWDEENRAATAIYKDVVLTVYPDLAQIKQNEILMNDWHSPVIQDNKIMLPIRAVAESIGCYVLWDSKEYIVSISSQKGLKVSFLDCGQADSIFAELPDGKCMLIDAAESSFGEKLETFIRDKGYSHIDYLVATHPHSDHIGAMAHILKKFSVGTFYMPDVVHTTKTYEKMIDALTQNGCKNEFVEAGSVIAEGEYGITVLSPKKREYIRMNDYSAVIKLNYKDVSILFSADAEATAEEIMLNSQFDLKADILKVGHHASATSSTDRYLDAVSPKDAVITVGRESEYGFPSLLVLMQLESRNINIHRTDKDGTVTAITDGYVYVIE